MEDSRLNAGALVRRIRTRQKTPQKSVALAAELAQSRLSQFEGGKTTLPLPTIERILDELDALPSERAEVVACVLMGKAAWKGYAPQETIRLDCFLQILEASTVLDTETLYKFARQMRTAADLCRDQRPPILPGENR